MTNNNWNFSNAPIFGGHSTYSKTLPNGTIVSIEPRKHQEFVSVYAWTKDKQLLINQQFSTMQDAMAFVRQQFKLDINELDIQESVIVNIKEDVRLPGTNIILEKGDQLKILPKLVD